MIDPPFPEYYESATVRLKWHSPETLSVSNLYSIHRREGHAKELMRRVCEYADIHAVRTILLAKVYGTKRGLDAHGLVRFYESFGFVRVTTTDPNVVFMMRLSQDLHTL